MKRCAAAPGILKHRRVASPHAMATVTFICPSCAGVIVRARTVSPSAKSLDGAAAPAVVVSPGNERRIAWLNAAPRLEHAVVAGEL